MQTPALDPRHFQIAVLAILAAFGAAGLGIDIRPLHLVVVAAVALGTQYLAGRLAGLARFDPLSALVTTLSLTILLRTDGPGLAALAALLAIGSKFLLRVRGKHLFNPANFAIVTLMLASDGAWISTGQWGSAALGALALSGLGWLVLTRARRAETTVAFLATFAALLTARALLLGDPLAIVFHHLSNGALLIFAFFMISDPKTTPDAAAGRLLFGAIVAGLAFAIQFLAYRPYGPLLALYACAPLTPLLDCLLGGARYRWVASSLFKFTRQEKSDATHATRGLGRNDAVPVRHRAGLLRLLRRPRGHRAVQPGLAGRAGPR